MRNKILKLYFLISEDKEFGTYYETFSEIIDTLTLPEEQFMGEKLDKLLELKKQKGLILFIKKQTIPHTSGNNNYRNF